MTGNDIFKQAMVLLNYTDNNGNVNAGNNANLNKRALPIVNQIYADLSESAEPKILTSLNEQIDLNRYALLNVMPYGVAMLLAQSDGDAENQTLYASLYNQRRASAFKNGSSRIDVLPVPYM